MLDRAFWTAASREKEERDPIVGAPRPTQQAAFATAGGFASVGD